MSKRPRKQVDSILHLRPSVNREVLKRLGIACVNCDWSEQFCDVHHIVHKKDSGKDDHSNLAYLCPNCHRLVHYPPNGMTQEEAIRKYIKQTFQQQVGDRWIQIYQDL